MAVAPGGPLGTMYHNFGFFMVSGRVKNQLGWHFAKRAKLSLPGTGREALIW